jgi:ribosome recycling factor
MEGVHKLLKDKEIGEDDSRGAEKQLDAVTKKHTDIVDELLKAKEAELLEV